MDRSMIVMTKADVNECIDAELRDTEANLLLDKLQVLNSIVDDHEVTKTAPTTLLYPAPNRRGH